MSEPEWDAPLSPYRPNPSWTVEDGYAWWTLDWRDLFRGNVTTWRDTGQMRGFHVVFCLRAQIGGKLICRDDDGSIIRRKSEVLRCDRRAHRPEPYEIFVEAGDLLTVAQWQMYGEWVWSARPASGTEVPSLGQLVQEYLPLVQQRCAAPTGPSVKVFTDGQSASRTIIGLYSLILNAYSPSAVYLFGDHQWTATARQQFAAALPFAEVVSTPAVCWAIDQAGGQVLTQWAMQRWWVMKACIAFFTDPREFCFMDDDVFVLDSMDDALSHFKAADLVFQADLDHGDSYVRAWGGRRNAGRLPTGRFNAGMYFMRNNFIPSDIARFMLKVSPERTWNVAWEQGLIASLFAGQPHRELPSADFFYPLVDGLPGGVTGYDYRQNPCKFKTIHFGGLAGKPDDQVSLFLARDILW